MPVSSQLSHSSRGTKGRIKLFVHRCLADFVSPEAVVLDDRDIPLNLHEARQGAGRLVSRVDRATDLNRTGAATETATVNQWDFPL